MFGYNKKNELVWWLSVWMRAVSTNIFLSVKNSQKLESSAKKGTKLLSSLAHAVKSHDDLSVTAPHMLMRPHLKTHSKLHKSMLQAFLLVSVFGPFNFRTWEVQILAQIVITEMCHRERDNTMQI